MINGSYLFSLLVCPIWFLVSIITSAVQHRMENSLFAGSAVPALTLGLVLTNNAVQGKIAGANAARVVTACEAFHAATGEFPKTLDELVPRYLPSIPRAKYCLLFGKFMYFNNGQHPILVWCAVSPFGKKVYSFEDRRWSYLD